MKNIKLTLIKSLILEGVKNETFHRGQVVKATDDKAIVEAYHEQAGDEAYHERILERSLTASLEELKTILSDYISESGQTSGDNTILSETDGDNIILRLSVNDRFNTSLTSSLAKLTSEYISTSILTDWWRPINEKQSALYAQFVQKNLASIRRCFNKVAPETPSYAYTTSISTTPGSTITMYPGEESSITYTLSNGAIDDVEAIVEDKKILSFDRDDNNTFIIKACRVGVTTIQLYSRHNNDINKSLIVKVVSL